MSRVRAGVSVGVLAAAAVLAGAGPLSAQTIRVVPASDSSSRQMVFQRPSGPFEITNYSVMELIRFAYGVADTHVIGAPAWTGTDRWDVEWQWNDEPTAADVQEMVQNLLALQFSLTTHVEQRPFPTYALVLAGTAPGPQLRPSSSDCTTAPATGILGVTPCQLRSGQQGLYLSGVTMAQVAREFSNSSYLRLDRPVVDRTGLSGRFDLEFSLVTVRQTSTEPVRVQMVRSNAPVATILARELGLTLREESSPLDVLAIDRVERPRSNTERPQ